MPGIKADEDDHVQLDRTTSEPVSSLSSSSSSLSSSLLVVGWLYLAVVGANSKDNVQRDRDAAKRGTFKDV